MWKEFKAFVMRGNVLDMAVGIIIGAAFGRIVSSLVNDIIMPPIGLLLGKVDFANLFIVLSNPSGQALPSVQAAKQGCWGGYSQLRLAHQRRSRLSHRGLGAFPGDPGFQPPAPPAGPARAQHQGVPVLLQRHPDQGYPLPELHFSVGITAGATATWSRQDSPSTWLDHARSGLMYSSLV